MNQADSGVLTPEWVEDGYCFACGPLNTHGLHLETSVDGRRLTAVFTPEKRFQGYANLLHGGILSLIMDEILVKLPSILFKTPFATLELNVRFKKPAPVGETLYFSAEVEGPEQRIQVVRGEARRADGSLVASAEARCIRVQSALGAA